MWKKISDYAVIGIAILAVVLASIAFLRKPEVKESSPSKFSLQRFGVAGGGEQFALEWESDGTWYEFVITKGIAP